VGLGVGLGSGSGLGLGLVLGLGVGVIGSRVMSHVIATPLMPLEHLKQAMIDITILIRPILRAETQHNDHNRMLLLSQLTTSYIINNNDWL